jgi:ABC-type uncharacterized transport system permease subunit
MTYIFTGFFAAAIYSLTGYLLGRRLFHDRTKPFNEAGLTKTRIIIIGLFAVMLHAITLYNNLLIPEGLNLGFFNAMSLIAWLMALLLLLAAFTNPVESLGVFLLPMTGIAVCLELIFPGQHTLIASEALELKLHILMSILAYSLFGLAAIHALLLAVQDNHLRNKRPGGFIRALPPLQTMENLLFQMIALGLGMLTLSLVTGSLYLDNMFEQRLAHKTILSMTAWVVFATLLWGRWKFGWRGKKAIRWTLSGFFVLMLAYMGSKWVAEIILGR